MVTHSKVGTLKPRQLLNLNTTTVPDPVLPHYIPSSFFEAIKYLHSKQAMTEEYNVVMHNRTWSLVTPSSSQNVIGSKWIFRVKLHPDGTIECYKARLVALKVTRSSNSLLLSQQKYIRDLLDKYGFVNCNYVPTLISPRTESAPLDATPLPNASEYRQLVGALQYLCITRPDITYAVNQASQFMHSPTTTHMIAAKRILRYLSTTKSHGIVFRASPSVSLRVFTDSDWAHCPVTRRSTSGYCIFFADNLITWSSKKQVTVPRSSTEAQYRCLAATVADLTWIQYLLCDLSISMCDPQVVHVPTHAQLADEFTKPLSGPKFRQAIANLCRVQPAKD
ncbi:transmembrane signal receptor [Lithospermum erythrorhizon]|uniref:Transmembrane signal receptor n=1 Tax=Lithospermum erythrorhizon TaxID=34254 RepID=A0AAV3QY56_LITER